MTHPFDFMARDAVKNLCAGRTATGDQALAVRLDFTTTPASEVAVVLVLDQLAHQIGDPSLAQLSPLPLLLLEYLAETGLTSPESISQFPVTVVAKAIRDDPAILSRPISLSKVLSR